LALSLPFEEQAQVTEWFESNGVAYQIQDFGWIGWRAIFTSDPEGNTVDLVACHPSLRRRKNNGALPNPALVAQARFDQIQCETDWTS